MKAVRTGVFAQLITVLLLGCIGSHKVQNSRNFKMSMLYAFSVTPPRVQMEDRDDYDQQRF